MTRCSDVRVYHRNYATNYVEVLKSSGVASIARVDFYREVLGQTSVYLGAATSAPFKANVTVNDVVVNTFILVRAVITTSDGFVLHASFGGRCREFNYAPTDLTLSNTQLSVRRAGVRP